MADCQQTADADALLCQGVDDLDNKIKTKTENIQNKQRQLRISTFRYLIK
jgi:hypothetical protein